MAKNLRKIQHPLSPFLMGNSDDSLMAKFVPQAPQGLSQILSMLGYGQFIIFNGIHIDANK